MAVNRTKTDQYQLRLPPGLREELREAAELHSRSMNAEIVERLEQYPNLVRLPMDISYLKMKNEQLKAELLASREALVEQKKISAQLQHLLSENFEDAKRREDNDREAAEYMETRLNELKAQSDYLESLKAELAQLSKERAGIKSEAEDLVKHQAEAIEMLVESQRATAAVLKDLANRQEPEITGTSLTPELFDKLFNQLVRVEQKLDERPKK